MQGAAWHLAQSWRPGQAPVRFYTPSSYPDHFNLAATQREDVQRRHRRLTRHCALVAGLHAATHPASCKKLLKASGGPSGGQRRSFSRTAWWPVRCWPPLPAPDIAHIACSAPAGDSRPWAAPTQPARRPCRPPVQPDGHAGCPLQPPERRQRAAAALQHQRASRSRTRPAAGERLAASTPAACSIAAFACCVCACVPLVQRGVRCLRL